MYIRQLDGVRCLAVMAVIVSHTFFYPAIRFFDLGKAGVDIFFTLSGFLITSILLGEKKKIEEGTSRLGKSLVFFYIRRFLRIFPLYYGVIAAAYIFNYYPARECFPWLVSFTGNWEIAHSFFNQPFLDFTHFWSLAVEEQFYVFFPLAILFIKERRTIKKLLVALVFAGIIARVCFFFYAQNAVYAAYFSTPGCLDVLSLGALLALEKDRLTMLRLTIERKRILLISCLLVLLFVGGSSFFKESWWGIIMGRTFTALFTCWIVLLIVNERLPAGINHFLQWKPAVYIGKISYGMYVFHPFVIHFLSTYFREKLPARLPVTPAIFMGVFLLASFSWEFFEKPLLAFKSRFTT